MSYHKYDALVKVPNYVTSVKAGVYKSLKALDSGLRRNDGISRYWTFYEFIKYRNIKGAPGPGSEQRDALCGRQGIGRPAHRASSGNQDLNCD